jgi:uncharacterized membrane protein YqjE
MSPAGATGAGDDGLFASLRRFGTTLVALVHTRLQLAGTELEEQVAHAASIVVWVVVTLVLGSLALIMAIILLLVAFWDSHPLLAAGLITATLALATLGAWLMLRHRVRMRPKFLAATLLELERDRSALARRR